MVQLVLHNGLPALVSALKTLESDRGLERDLNQVILGEWAMPAAALALKTIRKEAPVGKRWEENDFTVGSKTFRHGRPSERIFGKTLDQGWERPPYSWAELKEGGFDLRNDTSINGVSLVKVLLHGHPGAIVTPSAGKRLLAWNRNYQNWGRPGQTQTQIRSRLTRKPANRFDQRTAEIVRPELKALMIRMIPSVMMAIGKHLKFLAGP